MLDKNTAPAVKITVEAKPGMGGVTMSLAIKEMLGRIMPGVEITFTDCCENDQTIFDDAIKNVRRGIDEDQLEITDYFMNNGFSIAIERHAPDPSKELTYYAMGFVVDAEGKRVCLTMKSWPKFLKDRWTGIVGRVDDDETPLEAMRREFKEQTSADVKDWHFVKTLENPERSRRLNVFFARHDFGNVLTMTSEPIGNFLLARLPDLKYGKPFSEIRTELIEWAQSGQGKQHE